MRLLLPNIRKRYEEIGMMRRKYRVGKEGKAKKKKVEVPYGKIY